MERPRGLGSRSTGRKAAFHDSVLSWSDAKRYDTSDVLDLSLRPIRQIGRSGVLRAQARRGFQLVEGVRLVQSKCARLPLQRPVRMATAGVGRPERTRGDYLRVHHRSACGTRCPRSSASCCDQADELHSCSKVQQAWAWRCLCEFRSSSSPKARLGPDCDPQHKFRVRLGSA